MAVAAPILVVPAAAPSAVPGLGAADDGFNPTTSSPSIAELPVADAVVRPDGSDDPDLLERLRSVGVAPPVLPNASRGPGTSWGSGSPPIGAPSGSVHEPVPGDAVTPHPPISIEGDQGPTGFILGHDPATGTPIYRPGSGVVAGNGTAGNPYVITGWATNLVSIVDTTAHVVVEGNHVRSAGDTTRPVASHTLLFLSGAENVTVRDNTLVSGWKGLDARDARNLTVRDNHVVRNEIGLLVQRSPGARLASNRVDASLDDGIVVKGSPEARITGNDVTRSDVGILLKDSPRSRLQGNSLAGTIVSILGYESRDLDVDGNDAEGRYWGIVLGRSPNATVTGNTMEGGGLSMYGGSRGDFRHTLDGTNTVGGDPIAYFRDAENVTVPKEAAQAIVVGSRNVTVEGFQASNVSDGIIVEGSRGVRINDSTITDVFTGISVRNSTFSATGNRIGGTGGAFDGIEALEATSSRVAGNDLEGSGIRFKHGENNTIASNAVNGSRGYSIRLWGEQGDHLQGNEITHTQSWVLGIARGFVLYASSGNLVEENVVRESARTGITVWGKETHNTFQDNKLLDNGRFGFRVVEGAAEIRGNTIRGQGGPGVQFFVGGSTVTGNTIEDNGVGASLSGSTTVAGNRIAGNDRGVVAWGGAGTRVTGNVIEGNGDGIWSDVWGDLHVANNTVTENERGVALVRARDNLFVDNEITRNGVGVEVLSVDYTDVVHVGMSSFGWHVGGRLWTGDHTNAFHGNNIAGNQEVGLSYQTDHASLQHPPMNATRNWWGCPEGPDHPGCDDVRGRVDVDPWLTEPNGQAGAGS